MEFLKTTQSQLTPLFQSVSSTSSMRRNILLVVVLLIIGSAAWYANRDFNDQQVFLYGGRDFSPAEIGAMETALGRAGIEDYDIVENRIQIRQSQRAEVLKVIDDADSVPRCIAGYEPANAGFSPFMTGAQQRNLEKSKKQDKICAMIREIKGISDVMVEYDETRSSGFPRRTDRTAAVSVRPDGQRMLEGYEVETIRSMVQRAVAGMEPTDIVVIDGNSGIAHHWQGDQIVGQSENTNTDYASAKQHYEDIWKQKIKDALKVYPDAEVSVQVQLEQVDGQFASESRTSRSHPGDTAARIIPATALSTTHNTQAQRPISDRKPRAIAHFRQALPGSNGQARIQDFSVETADDADLQAEVFAIPVSIATPAATNSFQDGSVVRPASMVTSAREYIPGSASVSISISETQIKKIALNHKLRQQNQAAALSSGTTQSASEPGTPIIADQQVIGEADIRECFHRVQQDITHRIAPLLPGRDAARDPSRMIAVSMDSVVSLDSEPAAEQASANGWMHFASQIDIEQMKENWYTWTIPLVAVFGLALMWLNNRANAAADRQRKQQFAELQQEALKNQTAASQRGSSQEIEHSDLEPTEQEVKLATDIDRAFEADRQSNLSKEVVEMIQNDPETTIRVFRTWLNEA